MDQTSLELGALDPPPPAALSPGKVSFVEGMFAAWLAKADGNAQPTTEHKRRARAAAEDALRALA